MAKSFEKIRILLVDDAHESRNMIKYMLSDMGISQIYEAVDGREGFDFMDVADDMIDIVICDWNMPRMSGINLLQQIRTVNLDMPFLMVTGRCDMNSVTEARSAGVTAYIRKPFSQNELEAKLRIVSARTWPNSGPNSGPN
jgi:two-component system chemotaxis response regulator CheY